MKSVDEQVTVEKMVPGGLGLARLASGKSALISGVLPGEVVTLKVSEEKRAYLLAEPAQIVTPSAQRIKPPCRFYKQCGGCNLQHADPQAQREVKRQMVQDALLRVGGLDPALVESLPLPISGEPFGYRQRIRLHRAKRGGFGYRLRGSHQVIPIDHCLLAAEPLNEVLQQVVVGYDWSGRSGRCESLSLQLNPVTQGVKLMLYCDLPFLKSELKRFAHWAEAEPNVEAVFAEVKGQGVFNAVGKRAEGDEALALTAEIDDYQLSWEVGRFFQVNLRQNREMVRFVDQHLRLNSESRLLDLYCGVGNFSLPLARRAGSLLGVDSQGGAMRMARNNLSGAGLSNFCFEKGDAVQVAARLAADGERFSHLVLDPPRDGAAGVIPSIEALGVEQIAYISCDPVTLARDLGELLALGWRITALQPFDLFPQTHHVECVAVLRR